MKASIDELIAKMDAASIFYDGDDCAGSNLWKELKTALFDPSPVSIVGGPDQHQAPARTMERAVSNWSDPLLRKVSDALGKANSDIPTFGRTATPLTSRTEGSKPVALAHISVTDDEVIADLEVLDGTFLQPEMTPIALYLHPATPPSTMGADFSSRNDHDSIGGNREIDNDGDGSTRAVPRQQDDQESSSRGNDLDVDAGERPGNEYGYQGRAHADELESRDRASMLSLGSLGETSSLSSTPDISLVGYGLFDEAGKMLAWTDNEGFATATWKPDRVRPLFAGEPKESLVASLGWQEMATAPKDGTILRLLVAPDGDEFTPFDDSLNPYETIGFNNLADTTEDRWEFAGWDWSQDCFITGRGEAISWRLFAGSE